MQIKPFCSRNNRDFCVSLWDYIIYMEESLRQLYESVVGSAPESVCRLPGAGSNRRYYRMDGAERLIGVEGDDVDENRAFLYLCRHFTGCGLPVPGVVANDTSGHHYLLTDLGNTSLFDFIKGGRDKGEWTEAMVKMLEKTVSRLPDFQWKGAEGLDYSRCYPVAEMDLRSVMWDLNYFKYCFLKPSGLEFKEAALENDFECLASELLSAGGNKVFMYRDFQSRNVMIHEGEPWFIDFQGGRKGAYYYDVASFLWQAKARFPAELREHLIDVYIASASRYTGIEPSKFRAQLYLFVLFRLLQVLGAYGFRGYVEHKPHFLQSIPPAIDNLRQLIAGGVLEKYPVLADVLHRLVELPRFSVEKSDGTLTVKVASFGYNRHGIPRDDTGNGGGYVFDCRGLSNPGRYAEYKTLTGRDREVVDFLERDGGILRFLDAAYVMVDNSVTTYRERGFTSLTVSFGCTGGQHRSLYSADRMAEHLREKFPDIRIILSHYEQGINEVYQPAKSEDI